MTTQGDKKKPSAKFFRGEYRVVDSYTDMQSVADSAAKGNAIHYVMSGDEITDCLMTMQHTPKHVVQTFGLPSDITQLVSGFLGSTQKAKIGALKHYIATGGDVNVGNGSLLLAAMSSGYSEIVKFLFANSARVYSAETGLYRRLVGSSNQSVFNKNVASTDACLFALMEHLFATEYPVDFLRAMCDDNYSRLEIFTAMKCVPDQHRSGMCAFLNKCYEKYPEHTIAYRPQDPKVRLEMATKHGVFWDDENHAELHRVFLDTWKRLAVLETTVNDLIRT